MIRCYPFDIMIQDNPPAELYRFADERKFIHDLATPTTTIHLLTETSMEILTQLAGENPEISETLRAEVQRLQKVLDALQKITQKLQDRRSLLLTASSTDPESS